ncbi:MAG: DUF928 domain-containing protein [Potamolinea sp.]
MAWFKRSSRIKILVTILGVVFTLLLAFNIPARVQAQLQADEITNKLPNNWDFTPPSIPGESLPDNRQGGASRGNECIQGDANEKLTALAPFSVGETVAESPTIFWYLPKSSASQIDLLLQVAQEEDVNIYSAKYTLPKSTDGFVEGSPGIMSLTLPTLNNVSLLKTGQTYQWSLQLICKLNESSKNPWVLGRIKRVQSDKNLAFRISQATPQERVGISADAKLWYETLSALVELRRTLPNSNVTDAWNKLFKSVGLDNIAQK